MAISGNPGAIPDVDEYQPEQAPPPPQGQAPAQEAIHFRDAAPRAVNAIAEGINGLKRIFLGGGAEQQPGIPTEETMAQNSNGAQRFARGEGAATSDDVQAIDYSLGIDQVQADEGTKNMIRLDRATNYHLARGDKDKAEATAASLLQRGATQVRQAGVLARQAFENYQQTGDPKWLQQASRAMQRAHQLIPDGFDLQLDVDPKTHQLVATTTDSEGKANRQVIDPRAVPALLDKAMDGSAYWKSVFQIGQPGLARGAADDARSAAAKQDERAYQREFEQYKWERDQEADLEKEERGERKWVRQQQYLDETGRSATERLSNEQEQYFQDWNDRLAAAGSPQEQQQVLAEGLGYRYETARNRQTPVPEEELRFNPESQYAETFDPEDVRAMTNIARVIAAKNATLDGPGAMEATAILATQPQVQNNPDGTFNAAGFPLVFNPQLLPMLNELRKKYRVPQ